MMNEDSGKRRSLLDQLRRVLPPSPEWDAWLEHSGELPPDFDALRSHYDLPDPLEGVAHVEQWPARREDLKAQFQHWMFGSAPPPPNDIDVEILSERQEMNAVCRSLRLRFGPEKRAALRLELFIPQGEGPFPVFMTQSFHRQWALIALRRGYLACVYAGSDDQDDTDSFQDAYPGYDWSRIMRRAWAASRCVDYLATVPQANTNQIALTGHSRNGKLSMIASALDERFALVISSSSGAGGVLSARHFSEQHGGEGIEMITRRFPQWFHPRWRFFVGREHKLPVDLHELVALSAPRPCLLSIALNDHVESVWALQQTYLAAQRVYRFLDAEPNLRILYRPGSHETWPWVIEQYLDWCDQHFGRRHGQFAERLIYPHDWPRWKAANPHLKKEQIPHRIDLPPGSLADWQAQRAHIRRGVEWLLGTAPPGGLDNGAGFTYDNRHIATMLQQDAGEGCEKVTLAFGEHLTADIYRPMAVNEKEDRLPVVLWLHPFCASNGYAPVYRRGEPVFRTLARAGFAVFCFDQIGYGQRIEEVEGFYVRHPAWSLLGKMVRDSSAALDAVMRPPWIDPARVYGLGFGLGALVGLHLAAQDERLAGLAAVCPPPPFRLETDADETGGIARWSHLHMLLPRLGLYVGDEKRVPYDLDDLMTCLAPRPLLVVSPQLDREAPPEMVEHAVNVTRAVYDLHGASDQIEHQTPEAYHHFDDQAQQPVIAWLRRRAGLS